jgi:ankyrin repeat protein
MIEKKADQYNQTYQSYKDPEIELQQEYIGDFYKILQNKSDLNQRDDGYTILMCLAWVGRVELVKLAVEAGPDVNAISNDNSFALYEAARQGWKEVYDYLTPLTSPKLVKIAEKELPKGIIYRQRKNNYAVEAFVDDAFYGNINAVSTAISQGIDVNAISSNGKAALHKATRNNQLSIVWILLEAGANPNLKEEATLEYPPLMIALNSANIDYDIFQALLNAGANINGSSSRGETVLMLAIFKLNTKAVQQLLELGADCNIKDINGYTALTFARELLKQTFFGSTELAKIIQLLESYGVTEKG